VTSRTASAALATVALAALGAAGCGRNAPATTSAAGRLSPTTPAAKGDTGPVTWATYRDVGTLDPIQAVDLPENTLKLTESIRRGEPAVCAGAAAEVLASALHYSWGEQPKLARARHGLAP
jgi:hypothetical protein